VLGDTITSSGSTGAGTATALPRSGQNLAVEVAAALLAVVLGALLLVLSSEDPLCLLRSNRRDPGPIFAEITTIWAQTTRAQPPRSRGDQ
jgi:ABC-type uncharacterized transport system permease subunit